MSVFPVGKAHIDAMVNAAAQWGVISTEAEALAAGQMLWDENYRSVNHSHRERSRAPSYSVTATGAVFHPAAIMKIVRCYDYQTSEAPNWANTDAFAWCARLRQAALAAMTDDYRAPRLNSLGHEQPTYMLSTEYRTTPWGIETTASIPLQESKSREW